MKPFGKTAVGLILNKDSSGKKKETTENQTGKSKKFSEDKNSRFKKESNQKNTSSDKGKSVLQEGRNEIWQKDDAGAAAAARATKGIDHRDMTTVTKVNKEKKAHSGGLSECSSKQGSLSSYRDDFDNLSSSSLATSLGLNRIKTRSGPLTENFNHENNLGGDRTSFDGNRFVDLSHLNSNVQESRFYDRSEVGEGSKTQKFEKRNSLDSKLPTSVPVNSTSLGYEVHKLTLKEEFASSCESLQKEPSSAADDLSPGSWVEVDSNFDCLSAGDCSTNHSPPRSKQTQTCKSGSCLTDRKRSWHVSTSDADCSRNADPSVHESEHLTQSDTVKETDSPRFQALLRVTSSKKSKFPSDIKSFSHELDPKGVRSNVFWRPHNFSNLEEVVSALQSRFNAAKEEINTELEVFAGHLLEILEKNEDISSMWKEKIEDLLIFAQKCATMPPADFRQHCESIVQDLDDRRQDLPMGLLKQLHTRMLFILTRCTRLLQLTGLDEEVKRYPSDSKTDVSIDGPWTTGKNIKALPKLIKDQKISSPPRFYSQELKAYRWKEKFTPFEGRVQDCFPTQKPPFLPSIKPSNLGQESSPVGSLITERLAAWKKFSVSSEEKVDRRAVPDSKQGTLKSQTRWKDETIVTSRSTTDKLNENQQKKVALRRNVDELKLVCRICEETVPASQVGDHSRVCAVADSCFKGIGIDEKLIKLAEILEKMVESYTPKSSQAGTGVSPVLNLKKGEGSENVSPRLGDLNRRGSEDMLEDLHEMDAASLEDLRGFGTMNGKSRFGPKSDQGLSASSTGSRTPCSPITTPRTSQIDLLLTERSSVLESEDIVQINELADIARCAASTNVSKEGAYEYLGSCLQDLQDVLQHCKVEALTVDTFGRRIEKLLREKYLLVSEGVEHDSPGSSEEDEDDGLHSLRSTPMHPAAYKDRTSIDDFEIIKPISRGAFGRVFLARKRTTGDLFAIKVLRKADMVRKNAVESVHAERNILISARNPFVVRFFYSFTCKENLYLVMEYLNGGDMYSMLRNLGCLDEDMARNYIAELVLALEYLHSLGVVHRDLKPDNLLIAHDGHIKLTDFGLSKVGLINSTDDLSGPASRGSVLMADNLDNSDYAKKRELRQQRSAVGTPDYLAPEILLGTAHGNTADWWSVGVILFEFLTGVPPFNAEHPQIIFDNILNRNIPWPNIPEDMSYEAADLIEKLLAEDPNHRLGSKGAAEVKAHPFFKGIQWDTVGCQTAVFIPSPEGAHDTSYFTSRHNWNSTDERIYADQEFAESTDYASSCSGSSGSLSSRPEEGGDEYRDLAEFDTPSTNYPFNNFSFKNLSQLASINYDLLLQSGKDLPKP